MSASDADAPTPRSAQGHGPGGDPQFGPRGYLPERAAKRARKVVLREEMGLQWPLAAGVAALLLLVVGGLYLWTQTGPPGPPYEPAGAIAEVDPRGLATITAAGGLEVLVVRAGGGVRVFSGEVAGLETCSGSRRLRGPGGTVYDLSGRALGAGASLQPLPRVVHDGVLYVSVDPATWPPPPPPSTEAAPAC